MQRLLPIFLFLIAGCSPVHERFESWKGVHIANAFAQLGEPSKPLYKNEKVYFWDAEFDVKVNPSTNFYSYEIGKTTIGSAYTTGGGAYKGYCSFFFLVDEEKKITDYSFWGRDCAALQIKRNPNIAAAPEHFHKVALPQLYDFDLD